jgi:hypothetical protein
MPIATPIVHQRGTTKPSTTIPTRKRYVMVSQSSAATVFALRWPSGVTPEHWPTRELFRLVRSSRGRVGVLRRPRASVLEQLVRVLSGQRHAAAREIAAAHAVHAR